MREGGKDRVMMFSSQGHTKRPSKPSHEVHEDNRFALCDTDSVLQGTTDNVEKIVLAPFFYVLFRAQPADFIEGNGFGL